MLYLPQGMPAVEILRSFGLDVSEYALHDDAACPRASLRILLLNLMPHKEVTDLDIARTMAATGLDVVLMPIRIAGQTYKTTPSSYVDAFYLDFEQCIEGHFDGLIITGAPVEHLPFNQVRYWPQLCAIIDWSRTHVVRCLHICWGAQAALYHLYCIPKYPLPAKRFGIFRQHLIADPSVIDTNRLSQHLPSTFLMPHSRHTEVRCSDFEGTDAHVVAMGDESGVGVAISGDGHDVFVLGHLEYAPDTLDREYRRDLDRGLPIAPPEHYYVEDCPDRGIDYSWQSAAVHFYSGWLQS